ncbi:YceI family protein [Flavobacterium sp.]|uniref:YceI family protein n=1 Tax=Flavobacterium sp. TaxID=239 RepID=UPI00374CC060
METTNFKIVSANSQIDWTGRKITGAHNGTIDIKEGIFTLNDGKIKEGFIIINTSTIKILDIADPDTNAQFAGHLASDDFFSIEKFPTALFDILLVKELSENRYYLEGNLTIKDISNIVGFEVNVEHNKNEIRLFGKLVIDRTKFNIKFRSGNFFKDLGDTLIYNDFELDFNITAEAAFSAQSKN